jgi:cell division protein FtsZ
MQGARGLLINITGGDDLTLFEVDQAANRIREEVDDDANIIFGSAIDEALQGRIRVSVVATGIDKPAESKLAKPRLVAVGGGPLPQPIPIPGQAAGVQPVPVSVAQPLRQVANGGLVPAEQGYTSSAVPLPPEPSVGYGGPHPSAHPSQVAAPQQVSDSGTGLFAAEPRQAAAPVPSAPAGESRPSLFSTVTGAFRRKASTGEPAATRLEPMMHEPVPEPPRAQVRPAGGEEMGLDIPAFLRRQSS